MSAETITAMAMAAAGVGVANGWTQVCAVDRIVPDTGVTALVDGVQVAVFRLSDDRIYAIGNHDPCSKANVLSRGIVGDDDGRPFVASPVHKQRFDLTSGSCLDAPGTATSTFPVRVVADTIEVASSGIS
jgi:nitrite reductase (NADH) small subunit